MTGQAVNRWNSMQLSPTSRMPAEKESKMPDTISAVGESALYDFRTAKPTAKPTGVTAENSSAAAVGTHRRC